MVRTALASLTLLVASAACSHDAKSPTGPSNTGGVSPATTSAAAADLLGFLPADSEIVAGFDAGQLRASALWKKFAPKITELMAQGMPTFEKDCGFDPTAALQKMSLGIKDLTGQPQGVMVVHGFDRAKVMACIEKVAPPGKIKIDHEIITVSTGTSNNVAMEFVDPSTMVVFVGPGAAREGLQTAVQAGTPLRSSAAFNELVAGINTNESAWGLINGSSKMFAQAPFHPKAIFGSISAASGLALHAHLKMATAEDATNISGMIDGQAGQVRALVQTLDVAATGDDIAVSVAMTEQQLESLLALAGGGF